MMNAPRRILPGLLVWPLLLAGWAAASPENPHLRVWVHDETGAPVPFRAYLRNEDGDSVHPSWRTVRYERREEAHFLADGSFSLKLSPGEYHLRVERGLEWRPHEQSIRISPSTRHEKSVVLERWATPNAHGWYSGDTHVHRAPQDMPLAMRAEALNFAANLTLWNDKDAYAEAELPEPSERVQQVGPYQALNLRAQEIEYLGKGWGAVLFLGDFDPITPSGDPFYPLHTTYSTQARERGAHVDIEKPVWRLTPVLAALGLADSVGIVHNHFHPDAFLPMDLIRDAIVPPPTGELSPRAGALYTLDLYYHLLNSGVRIAASGGSASGVMPAWPGYNRTYVKLDVPFRAEAWLEGLKAGRSFATNGPLLYLTVHGSNPGEYSEPGDEIASWSPRPGGRLRALAHSQNATLERLEIVHNGIVVGESVAAEGAERLEFDQRITLPGPGWISARAFEIEGNTQRFAVTSPIYLRHGEDVGLVPESRQFYADFIETLIEQTKDPERHPNPAQRAEALATLEEALEFFR